MARPSMQQYLQYLKGGPRMMGWGALLIYDRAKTNQLLAQEYIEHLNGSDYFPPFSSTEETGGSTKVVMNNFKFDAPVLSFINSNISHSRARLAMKIIHGEYITLNKPLGGTDHSIVSIATINALNAPSLHMDIDLFATDKGNIIDDEGQVALDLSDGENHNFSLSSSEHSNRVLGIAIKKHFDSWDDESKRFVINRIVRGDGDLKPTSFAIRTHSLANSGVVRSTEEDDKDEGAVIVGVAMNNEPNGGFPVRDTDLPYLLPDDYARPFGMNILVANHIWFFVITMSARRTLDHDRIEYTLHKNSKGFLDGIDLIDAHTDVFDKWTQYNPRETHFGSTVGGLVGVIFWVYQIYRDRNSLDFSGLKIRFSDGKAIISWVGEHVLRLLMDVEWAKTNKRTIEVTNLNCSWELEAVYELNTTESGPDIGRVRYQEISITRSFEMEDNWYGGFNKAHSVYRDWFTKDVIYRMFNILCHDLTVESAKIDALFLNNLLFKNKYVAMPSVAKAPGDMSLLGDLSLANLSLAILPVKSVISANSTLQFTLQSAQTGATWSLELLPGENGEKGSISSTGLYRAPSPSTVPPQGRRVKVVARKDNFVAHALIYLVQSDVSVYPSLQVAQHSHIRYLLVGGSGDGTPLKWGVTPTSLGSVRGVTGQDREDMDIPDHQDVQIYVSPPVPTARPDDWRAAVQRDQVTVTGASGTPTLIDILIPWSNPASWFETKRTGQTISLTTWTQTFNGPIALQPDIMDWYVVKGTGELKDGVYTLGDIDERYAIIVAIEKDTNFFNYAYVVLPFALIDLKTLEMIDTPEGADHATE